MQLFSMDLALATEEAIFWFYKWAKLNTTHTFKKQS
jgi:hypothetical protein